VNLTLLGLSCKACASKADPALRRGPIESSKMGSIFFGILIILGQGLVVAEDPYQYEDWTVSYIDASPLGVTQKVRSASLHLLSSTLHSQEGTFLTFSVFNWRAHLLLRTTLQLAFRISNTLRLPFQCLTCLSMQVI
jgi:hypothetical protein